MKTKCTIHWSLNSSIKEGHFVKWPSLNKLIFFVLKYTAMKKIFNFLLLIITVYSNSSYAQYVIPIAGTTYGYYGDGGPATAARFSSTNALCRDAAGNLYVGDNGGEHRVRRIDAVTGIVTTIAGGTALPADTLDNVPATSAFIGVSGLCVDVTGNYLYIADDAKRVRMVNLSTGIITTVAGSGAGVYGGDGGQATAASLGQPIDVAIDSDNNLYIAEYFNNTIRKVTAATGIITTIAGTPTPGAGGDGGPATAAQLDAPCGISLDGYRNIYIADENNNRVRRIDAATGIITTIAGCGPDGSSTSGSYSGDGGPATAAHLNTPQRVIPDKDGNIFIADYSNFKIRRVDAITGYITTYAGGTCVPGSVDSVGDNGPATSASIIPFGMCIDSCENLYFDDEGPRIRAVTPTGPALAVCGPPSLGVQAANIKDWNVYPNPATGQLTIKTAQDAYSNYTITNSVGQILLQNELSGAATNVNVKTLVPGLYYITLSGESGTTVQKFVKM
jgi:sugar lactone lactonase YvrE